MSSLSTSLGAALASELPPPRVPAPDRVRIRRWKNPYGKPWETIDVTLECGLLLRGVEVRGSGENRRVSLTGWEFSSVEAKKQLSAAILAAFDAGEK